MDPADSAEHFDALRALVGRSRGADGVLLEALRRARARSTGPTAGWAPAVAGALGLPAAAGLGPADYYADLAAPHGRRHVRVCTGAACFAARGGRPPDGVEEALGVRTGAAAADGSVSLQAVRCLGHCYAAPACLDGGTVLTGPDLAGRLVAQAAGGGGRPAAPAAPAAPPVPAADATRDPALLGGVVAGEAAWQVWPRTVSCGTPEQVRAEVAVAGLRGRGGAGFPVAAKWAAAGGSPGTVVVANGDEGDPGSYADRLLMESDPGRVLEGLALACFACGARRGVVLVRSEYPRALAAMREQVRRAYADGHLGRDVHGSGTDLDVGVAEGAGSYVAGEETALIAGLEGGRGCARPRPPYPTRAGLWDAPTVVNNVETLAALPWIVRRGGAAWARRGGGGGAPPARVWAGGRLGRAGGARRREGPPPGPGA
ncbi:NAD(P)H-dependent oxidoreductase subunit E, partial [Streptomyces sp. NPDC059506]|uniref:NAD(P)H-dependent oxidoreductase subunit E n=1 Tax=Streptomyces sp. NPDC059506 TaxID=3347751 RepID=UPI003697B607